MPRLVPNDVQEFDKTLGIDGKNKPEYLNEHRHDLGVSTRLFTILTLAGIEKLDDIRKFNLDDFAKAVSQGFGKKSREELEQVVYARGGWFLKDHENPDFIKSQIEKGKNFNPEEHVYIDKNSAKCGKLYAANKLEAVTNTQGGCVIETLEQNLSNNVFKKKLEALKEAGIEFTVQIICKAKPSNNDRVDLQQE